MFGLGSLPAGRLGDQWGRRAMIVIFFIGLGVSALVVAATRDAWQMAVALSVMGAFSAIYHPVGIPMLVQGVKRPGATIGISGLAGNLGIAAAAVLTGFLVSAGGWRLAFIVPGIVAILLGLVFLKVAPAENEPPAKRGGHRQALPKALLARVFLVVTGTAITGSLLFNFTTNGNGELLRERLTGIVPSPTR
jgi:MFS family permease